MNTTKPTPGPWKVCREIDKRRPIEIRTTQPLYNGAVMGALVAKIPRTERSDYDASIIAAAPDLLEALKELVNAEYMVTNDFDGNRVPLIDAARAAIAKATGATP